VYIKKVQKGGVLVAVMLAVVGTPFFVFAASQASPVVVESRESGVMFRPPIEEAPQVSGSENQYQMQLLQQEVMELRGAVERLEHELKRLKSVQDDRYLELDGRLQQLLQARGTQSSATRSSATRSSATRSIDSSSDAAGDQPDASDEVTKTQDLTEEALYNTTQQLIRNRQYEMAITQLESLIERFPEGEYTANTYYWLGQVQAAKTNPDFEKARQSLVQVITYFPEHGKVPDAAFALGKVLHTLGDCERAKSTLEQVRDQYPGKSAAKLAANYLRESVSCEP
jgi:tol-pal system protein YbgF